MIRPGDRKIQMVIHVARRLGDLREKVVFLEQSSGYGEEVTPTAGHQ
ncbi:MAG: hypothetical protein HY879_10025 [Deltaproteobacteria bacterium]|nr:hypothetical protein [Deltaproteobacteria bacterium]